MPAGLGGVPVPGRDDDRPHPLSLVLRSMSADRQEDFASAWIWAQKLHEGQRDKAGSPYFDAHVVAVTVRAAMISPLHVRDDVLIAAVLHDTVEDGTRGPDDGAEMLDKIDHQWGPAIRDAVDALTQRKTGKWITLGNDEWPELERRILYIRRVQENQVAVVVKLADNLTNADPSALALIPDRVTRERLTDKYRPERNRLRRAFKEYFGTNPGMSRHRRGIHVEGEL